jgi:hypothetical protein
MISEDRLNSYAICPLYNPPTAEPIQVQAEGLFKWAMLRTFDGIHDPPDLTGLRERYVSLWNKHWFGDQPKTLPATGPYWDGPKASRGVARRIFEFLDKYEVVHPEQPYDLKVDKYTIQGRYALVRRKTQTGHPSVLVVHDRAPLYKASPDLRSLARFTHANTTEYYKEIGILHLPLLRGQVWSQVDINETLATTWLRAILDQIPGVQYPVPGSHCMSCEGKPCMGVFRER